MTVVAPGDRGALVELFALAPRWKAFVCSAVEDGLGEVRADDPDSPAAAVLFYGGLVIYAGDATNPAAADLVRAFPVQPLVLAGDEAWNALLIDAYGEVVRRGVRYHMPFESLDASVMQETGRAEASGERPPRDEVRAGRTDDVPRLADALGWEHQLVHYRDAADFVRRGFPRVIERDGGIVAGASAFCRSSGYAECQVTVREAYRRQGLGSAVAAAFVEACCEAGVAVPWDAANRESVAVGRRIGYGRAEEYDVFEIIP